MPPVRATLLMIGDELLAGDILDRNATHMATELRRWGVEVVEKRTVRDRVDEIVAALRDASRYEICLSSGGLGPTTDDLTALSVAKAAGVELERDLAVVELLKERFAGHLERHAERFGEAAAAALIETNLKQADLPKGSERLDNPVGTAPGFALELPPVEGEVRVRGGAGAKACWMASMPGVPRELHKMLAEQVRPKVLARHELRPRARRVFRLLGDGESSVQNRLAPISKMLKGDPELAGVMLHYRAHTPEILLTFEALPGASGKCATPEALEKLDGPMIEVMGNELYAIGEEDLPTRLVDALVRAKCRVATAESCTAGGIGAMLTEVPGSSAAFSGGVIAYANEIKRELLGVSADVLERDGAVSEPVALAMAKGAHQRFGSDLSVGITGIAGPGGGTPEKPVGLVHIAVCDAIGDTIAPPDPGQTMEPKFSHRRLRLRGNRATVRRSSAVWALKMLWDQLLERGLAQRESSSEPSS